MNLVDSTLMNLSIYCFCIEQTIVSAHTRLLTEGLQLYEWRSTAFNTNAIRIE